MFRIQPFLILACLFLIAPAAQGDTPKSKQPTPPTADEWEQKQQKRRERNIAIFHKLDVDGDKQLTVLELLGRFKSLRDAALLPKAKREEAVHKRVVRFEQRFKDDWDADKNGKVDITEFTTRFFKPMIRPEKIAAKKAENAAKREQEEAERKRKVERRDKEDRDKSLERPKADRSLDK